ncbi:helix-turn-helix domain-containing protein [Pannonibacter phragmitetus]|uniref:helix-turn-helix domain-containing protein n=1 Tax=Pannonibacter phragmitetus TaxID=121719 RepID=UPI00198230B3|nr:helix-turn-helix domain-containing protein [Pannonibacter phragmitetus]
MGIMGVQAQAISRKTAEQTPLAVALVYEGLSLFEFSICTEVFASKKPEVEGPWYRFAAVAVEAETVSASGGVSVRADEPVSLIDEADIILVPGWPGRDHRLPPGLKDRLQKAHARGARLVTFCSGAFLLAAAGLLDGRRATTHWRYIPDLRRVAPASDIVEDVLFVEDGTVLTAAGSAAGIDLSLSLVRRDFGWQAANALARSLVVPAQREGGQAQFVPRPVARFPQGSLAPLLERIERELDQEWDLQRMAQVACCSLRTLSRRFRDATGLAPLDWLIRARIRHACHLLEASSESIDAIATRCGFGAPETFRLHFRRIMTVPPSRYRSEFQGSTSPISEEASQNASLRSTSSRP